MGLNWCAMTWKPLFCSLVLGAGAVSLAAQTATTPATTPHTTTTVHHTGTVVSHCPVPTPTLSPKIPAIAVHGCPKLGYALTYVDTRIGTGDLALPKKWYTVQYTGYLATDGTKFDSSYDHPDKKPITFPYGAHRVIPGWDTGFEGMRIGGKRRLYVPYQLAYGEIGRPPVIPPKSELIFDIELVSQSDTPPPQPPGSRPQPGAMPPGAHPGMGQPGAPGAMHPPTGGTPPPSGAPSGTTPPASTAPTTTTPPTSTAPSSTTPPTSTAPTTSTTPPASTTTPPPQPQ
jgi:peptidylprolyl isomerase